MTAILQLLIISTISAAFARRLLSKWEPAFSSTSERLLFEFASGLAILGFLMFVLGAVQAFYLPAFLGLLLGMAAVSWSSLTEVIKEVVAGLGSLRRQKWTLSSAVVTAVVAIIAALALIRALAPPVGDDWDSLAYHLAIPKLFLAHHGFYYIPFASHSNFPFTWEMLYTLGLAFNSVALAKLFHYAAGLLLLWGIFSLSCRYFGRKAAGLAVLVAAGIPVAAWEATSGYVDLAAALYSFLTIYALINYSSTRDRGWAVMAGIAVGAAGAVKMTGLAMIPITLVWLLWPAGDRKERRSFAPVLIAAATAILLAAPWYIKTFIFTGNPVYPFFYGIFGGRNWSPYTAELYRVDQLKFGMGRDAASFLMIPWNLTFHFARFHDYAARIPLKVNELPGLTGSSDAYLVAIGPLFVAALPVMILSALKKGVHRPLLAVSFLLILIWFFMTQQSRYMIPVFALLAPAVAWAAYDSKVGKVLTVLAAVTGLFTAFLLTSLAVPAAPAVFGTMSRHDYLMRFDLYRTSEFINTNLPKDAKVALYGETRGFYLNRDYFWADSGHNAIIPVREEASRLGWLSAHSYRYVLVNHRTFQFDGGNTPAGLEQIYSDQAGGMSVYRILR